MVKKKEDRKRKRYLDISIDRYRSDANDKGIKKNKRRSHWTRRHRGGTGARILRPEIGTVVVRFHRRVSRQGGRPCLVVGENFAERQRGCVGRSSASFSNTSRWHASRSHYPSASSILLKERMHAHSPCSYIPARAYFNINNWRANFPRARASDFWPTWRRCFCLRSRPRRPFGRGTSRSVSPSPPPPLRLPHRAFFFPTFLFLSSLPCRKVPLDLFFPLPLFLTFLRNFSFTRNWVRKR